VRSPGEKQLDKDAPPNHGGDRVQMGFEGDDIAMAIGIAGELLILLQ
jgi:hypothetical protein